MQKNCLLVYEVQLLGVQPRADLHVLVDVLLDRPPAVVHFDARAENVDARKTGNPKNSKSPYPKPENP